MIKEHIPGSHFKCSKLWHLVLQVVQYNCRFPFVTNLMPTCTGLYMLLYVFSSDSMGTSDSFVITHVRGPILLVIVTQNNNLVFEALFFFLLRQVDSGAGQGGAGWGYNLNYRHRTLVTPQRMQLFLIFVHIFTLGNSSLPKMFTKQ